MESKKINQLATNVNPQTSDLTTIGDPITGQLKKITWLQVANLIGAQASVTLQQVTDNGNTTTDPITTAGLTLTNLGTGVPQVTNGEFVSTYGYGLANGVATLDSGGKIPAAQLPSSVMEYKGTWNASTNTPTLADGTGDNGDVYLVNVAGSQNLGSGTISFAVGDWVVYNGTIWQKSLNSNAVASVFGRTGTIVAQEGDYNIDQLGDVAITSAATNDYLRYNGSSWVNTQFPTFVSSDKLVLQVRNNSGATINKGTVVYINGATAGYPTIAKAQADADNTSAQTLGLVQDNISNNSNGVVVIVGQITGIDTSAYPAGTQLYLSGTTAGAFTSTKTLAPTHLVYVGIVTTQNAVNGVIEVKIQNGYELDEIHDVAISSVANNQGLFYESSTSLWKNKSIATVLGYTPEQPLTFSAPLSRSTNTVSIPAATGSVNGYLTSTDWTTFNNKLTSPMTTLGDIIFGGTSGNANRLAGNTTTTKQYLSQTGTGTESASPTWATITGSDIIGAALTKSDDTNVTLTLGGTPATALLRAASLTLGWTGTLAVSRGGTGASSFGSNEIIYGNSASALQSSNQFTFSPTGVFFINNTISAGGIAMNLTSTVNAAANNDIIYGVRISPTFNNLSFTGVTQRALGVFGDVYINGTITSGAWGGSTITIAKGGTGLTALGTAGQLLRVNSGATALEYFTPTYISDAITSLNGLTAATQTFATGTTGTDFNISSTTSTHTFNLPTASATNRGALSSTDWSTFNSKQAQLNGTGFVKASGTTISYDNSNYLTTDTLQSISATKTFTVPQSGGSGDFTNVTSSSYKISTASSYWRIPHISTDANISGVYNYETGKDVYWGESTDTGIYYFRGRSINVQALTGTSASFSSTVSATAFIPTGSTVPTNGMYLSAANTLSLSTNSTRAITISDGQKVGIGADPISAYRLYVNGDTNIAGTLSAGIGSFSSAINATEGNFTSQVTITTDVNIMRFGNLARWGFRRMGADNRYISFIRNANATVSAVWTVDGDNGNVSIGTDLPSLPNGGGLILYKSDYPRLQFKNSTSGDGSLDGAGFFLSGNNFYISNRESGDLVFEASANTERFRIQSNGVHLFGVNAPANTWTGLLFGSGTASQSYGLKLIAGSNSSDVAFQIRDKDDTATRFQVRGDGFTSITSNLTANSPSAGNTGEGIIAGTSFKIDASGTGQKAKMYVVSKDLSDTYGSGLQIQFANQADDKGFGFNLNTSGGYETYIKSSGSWNRAISVNTGGNMIIGSASVPSGATEFNNGTLFTSNNIYINNSSGTSGYAVRIDGYANSLYFIWQNASGADQGGVALGYGNTSWTPVTSDARNKKNFETTQGLAEILQIETVKYHLLTDDDNAKKRLGFKAQNLQPLISEMVIPNGRKAIDGSDYLTIIPDYLLPVIVKAIQEQQAQIEELKSKLA